MTPARQQNMSGAGQSTKDQEIKKDETRGVCYTTNYKSNMYI